LRKRDVNKLCLKWRDRLWLGHWRIGPVAETEIAEKGENGYETAAYVSYEAVYQDARVHVSEKVWDKRSPASRNRTMCHEMVHLANAPVAEFIERVIAELPSQKGAVYKKWWDALNEENTTHWTNVMLGAHKELA
jgi:hypothetical protein